MVSVCWTLSETAVLFSPPAVYESFNGSASSPDIVKYSVTSHNAFNFHFPNGQWCWTIFHGLFVICISSSETHLFDFALLFIMLFIFLLLSFEGSLCIGDASSLSETWFVNVFFQSVACLFIHCVFNKAKVVNFDEVQFINFFSSSDHAFGIIFKRSLTTPSSWRLFSYGFL